MLEVKRRVKMDIGAGGLIDLPNDCRCQHGLAQNFSYYAPIDLEAGQVSFFEERQNPVNGLQDPYEFTFESMGNYFLDMSSMYLHVRLSVKKANGDAILAAAANIWPVENFLNSLFKTVETKVNNHCLQPSASLGHGYKSLLENLLSVDKSIHSYLAASMYTGDDATRKSAFKKVQTGSFDLCGPLQNDTLRASGALAPGNRLTLTLYRQSDQFCLITTEADTQFKIEIEDIAMYGRRILLHPRVLPQVLKPGQLQTYTMQHTELHDYPIAANVKTWSMKLHSGSTLPHQIVIGFVLTSSFVGDIKSDPYKFQNFALNFITLRLNGQRTPQEALTPSYSDNLYNRTLMALYQNSGRFRVNQGNSISPSEFKSSKALYVFDISPDQCSGAHSHVSPGGTIDVEVSFSTALAKSITCVTLSLYNQILRLGGESVTPVSTLF